MMHLALYEYLSKHRIINSSVFNLLQSFSNLFLIHILQFFKIYFARTYYAGTYKIVVSIQVLNELLIQIL